MGDAGRPTVPPCPVIDWTDGPTERPEHADAPERRRAARGQAEAQRRRTGPPAAGGAGRGRPAVGRARRFSIRRWRGAPAGKFFDLLEDRQMMAAHVLGSTTSYATIQGAGERRPGGAGTVTVDAGTYAETVTINKSLTIQGAEAGVDARGNGRREAGAESIVTGATTSAGRRHVVRRDGQRRDDRRVHRPGGETSQDLGLGRRHRDRAETRAARTSSTTSSRTTSRACSWPTSSATDAAGDPAPTCSATTTTPA